eukprot:2522354-Amphidinium_carterae.2
MGLTYADASTLAGSLWLVPGPLAKAPLLRQSHGLCLLSSANTSDHGERRPCKRPDIITDVPRVCA